MQNFFLLLMCLATCTLGARHFQPCLRGRFLRGYFCDQYKNP
jgi:hypothetical protein